MVVCSYVSTHIHTYMHTYILYMHTHTGTHTHIQACVCVGGWEPPPIMMMRGGGRKKRETDEQRGRKTHVYAHFITIGPAELCNSHKSNSDMKSPCLTNFEADPAKACLRLHSRAVGLGFGAVGSFRQMRIKAFGRWTQSAPAYHSCKHLAV